MPLHQKIIIFLKCPFSARKLGSENERFIRKEYLLHLFAPNRQDFPRLAGEHPSLKPVKSEPHPFLFPCSYTSDIIHPEMQTEKSIIVIGLGNPLMGDEGIGTALIEKLTELAAAGKIPGAENIRLHDGGTGGMNLLHSIAGRKKAILIDCALMGTEPGTLRRFTPDQVQTVKKLAHQSLHEVDILKVIELARQLGECPDQVVFFGIEPKEITQRMSLSEALIAQIDRYIQAVLEELKGSF